MYKTLRCGTNNLPLTSTSERHRRELYAVDPKKQDAWTYAGSMDHTLSVASVKERTDSVDHALEVLKSRVAAEKQEREVNKYVVALSRPLPRTCHLDSSLHELGPSPFLPKRRSNLSTTAVTSSTFPPSLHTQHPLHHSTLPNLPTSLLLNQLPLTARPSPIPISYASLSFIV